MAKWLDGVTEEIRREVAALVSPKIIDREIVTSLRLDRQDRDKPTSLQTFLDAMQLQKLRVLLLHGRPRWWELDLTLLFD